jgi:diguanylate cyclase (GGDEF)-like protein
MRLQTRIVVLFLALMLAIQLAGFAIIRAGIQQNARTEIGTQLAAGERVLDRLLAQSAQKLTQGARLLAADYGFREALASDDRETIGSALGNHSGRIGATLALLYGLDGAERARSAVPSLAQADAATGAWINRLIAQAERDGDAAGTRVIDGRLHQVVVVPVKAPIPIAWVAMGFAVDEELARDLRQLSLLHVSFVDRRDGRHTVLGSTLSEAARAALAQQAPDIAFPSAALGELELVGESFGMRVHPVGAGQTGAATFAVLQRSIEEAIAPYRRLQLTLLLLTAFGLAASVLGSVLTARRITRPVLDLVNGARLLARGDYSVRVQVPQRDEIGQLASAFNQMSEGLSVRERQITRLAYWDTLTGLPNRVQFVDKLREALERNRKQERMCSVLMMDLDRFKVVNDVLGHQIGDVLLREAAERLMIGLAGRTDLIARLGGDEFAVLLEGESPEAAVQWGRSILLALEAPFSVQGQTVDLRASIGIAGYPAHGTEGTLLLSRAEVAMYTSKSRNAGILVYDPRFDENSQRNLSLMTELKQAIEQNQFVLLYQPKVHIASGEVWGGEALIRWAHPQRGFVPPDRFIPFAEQTGFIRDITRWVLRQAVTQCAAWRARGHAWSIAVNLSTRDLMDLELPQWLGELLQAHGVPPAAIGLEITESAIMEDPARALQTLELLDGMGFGLSIDDFGTGYSSLAYLKRLPIQELKIDKSFVMSLNRDADDAIIVRATVDLAHNLGVKVVAEGVESAEIWSMLRALGCDLGQGYHLSKPVRPEEFERWAMHGYSEAAA